MQQGALEQSDADRDPADATSTARRHARLRQLAQPEEKQGPAEPALIGDLLTTIAELVQSKPARLVWHWCCEGTLHISPDGCRLWCAAAPPVGRWQSALARLEDPAIATPATVDGTRMWRARVRYSLGEDADGNGESDDSRGYAYIGMADGRNDRLKAVGGLPLACAADDQDSDGSHFCVLFSEATEWFGSHTSTQPGSGWTSQRGLSFAGGDTLDLAFHAGTGTVVISLLNDDGQSDDSQTVSFEGFMGMERPCLVASLGVQGEALELLQVGADRVSWPS